MKTLSLLSLVFAAASGWWFVGYVGLFILFMLWMIDMLNFKSLAVVLVAVVLGIIVYGGLLNFHNHKKTTKNGGNRTLQ